MNEKLILCYMVLMVLVFIGMVWWLWGWTERFSKDLAAVKKNTEIQVNKNVPVIRYFESNIRELKTEITIPWDVYKSADEDLEDYVKNKIAKDLAASIVPFVDIIEDNDYCRNTRVYHARIRVIGK